MLVFFIPICLLIGKAVAAGKPCKIDTDCTDGQCVDGTNTDKVCQGVVAAGSACSHNSECGSNDCDVGGTGQCRRKHFSIKVGF